MGADANVSKGRLVTAGPHLTPSAAHFCLTLQGGGGGGWQTDGGEQLLLLGAEGGDTGDLRRTAATHMARQRVKKP
jgi:hypothetical protein